MPGVVLVLSVLAAILASLTVGLTIHEKDEARFQGSVRWITQVIDQGVELYSSTLRAGAAWFAADQTPSGHEFHEYVTRLELARHYSGAQGIGFAERVPSWEKTVFEKRLQRLYGPAAEIKPPGLRPEYFPIVFLEPLDQRNEAAIGYDMFAEPIRQAAMARARDLGRQAATGKVELMQEIDPIKQAGFLIYTPVYRGGNVPATLEERRRALLGFVYSPFRADDMFHGIFENEARPRLHYEVYDGLAAAPANLLHASSLPASKHPEFTAMERLNVHGRPWTLVFKTTPEFAAASSRALAGWVLAIGLLLSVGLAGITYALARARGRLELARAELQSHAETLEQTVQDRTARLRETVHELEYMSYSITHDLRAPLRAIQSFGGILEEEAAAALSPAARGYLDRMKAAAQRMDALIRDVLRYGEMVRADLPLYPVALSPLLRGIRDTYPMLLRSGAEIDLPDDLPRVRGNEAALTQCFSNLFSNAVKFVPPDRPARVRVFGERRNGMVRVSVQDNGIGIRAELQGKLFGIFQRLEPAYEGTGIGLAIVKKSVERMGGRVGLDSTAGQGSTFWVELPAA